MTRIYDKLDANGVELPIPVSTIAVFIGISHLISAVAGAIPLKFFGRKPVLAFGMFLMCACHFLSALFLYLELYVGMLWTSSIFLNVFPLTFGSCIWSYLAEVTVDSASGLTTAGQFIVSIAL